MHNFSVLQPGYGAAPPMEDEVLNFFKSYRSEVGCTVEECFEAIRATGLTLGMLRCAATLLGH